MPQINISGGEASVRLNFLPNDYDVWKRLMYRLCQVPSWNEIKFVLTKQIREREPDITVRLRMVSKEMRRLIRKLSFAQVDRLRRSPCYRLYDLNVRLAVYVKWLQEYRCLDYREQGRVMREIEKRIMNTPAACTGERVRRRNHKAAGREYHGPKDK